MKPFLIAGLNRLGMGLILLFAIVSVGMTAYTFLTSGGAVATALLVILVVGLAFVAFTTMQMKAPDACTRR